MAPSRNACAAVLANALSKKTTPKWPGTDCTLLRSGAAHDPLGRVDDQRGAGGGRVHRERGHGAIGHVDEAERGGRRRRGADQAVDQAVDHVAPGWRRCS